MMSKIWCFVRALALGAVVIAGVASVAMAQVPMAAVTSAGDGSADVATPNTAQAIAALEAGGATVLVIPADAPPPMLDTAQTMSAEAQAALVRERVGAALAAAPRLPSALIGALREAGGGSLSWLWGAVALTAFGLGIGTAAYFGVRHFCLKIREATLPPVPQTRGERIGYAFSYIITMWLAAAAFLLAGGLAIIIVDPEVNPERITAGMVLRATAAYLAFRGVLLAVINGEGEGRLAPFDKPLASALQRRLLIAFFVTNAAAFICFWSAWFPLEPDAHKFMLFFAATFAAVTFVTVILMHRKALTAAFFHRGVSVGGLPPRPAGPAAKLAGMLWPVGAVAYFAFSWVANVRSIMLDSAPLIGPVVAPIMAFVAALAATGAMLFIYDTRARANLTNERWTELFEKAAYGAGFIVWFAVLAALWELYATPYAVFVERAILLFVTLLLSWAALRAVNIAIDQRLAEEMPGEEGADQQTEGEGFGPGASRIATLLPIARNVAFFFVAAVVLMGTLASVGVNVGPLFAGAGVLGLAVGFGAQALIRDIFSGAFFLLDDAFRKGEYIDVGGTAGMVEKISVRSFQLRHHEGPLHTLPFGEIKQLTNFSRDWVIMKLPIRLTYDTDIEKVRKLVKKVGQQMAADPEIGHYFIEPPKSQGVVQMEDSAMIIRVKFMTKPGDQFLVRKHVFQRIRDAFTDNDIHFAHREVTVRVAGGDDPQVQRAAAAAAAAESATSRPTAPAAAMADFAGQ